MNIIPGLSQVKSFVQLVSGDKQGALATQEDFFTRCTGVSQLTSVTLLINGDAKMALDVQKKCISTVGNFLDSVPAVGHVKGGIHYLFDDQAENNPSCDQIKMRKSDYQQIKQDAIPQRNSRATNQELQQNGQTPKNLINNERLHAHPHGKVNLGIKGQTNLDNFNVKILEIKIIDPKSMQYINTVTKFVGTHGKPTATACIPQGVQQNEKHED